MTRASTSVSSGWLVWVVLIGVAVVAIAYQGITREEIPVSSPEAHAQAQLPQVVDDTSVPDAQAVASAPPTGGLLTPEYAPWEPGTTFNLTHEYPEPGVAFSATECTVALSFSGSDGRMYAVTASHCGSKGDLIFPRDGETIADYTSELGRVIYSGLDEPSPSGDDDRRPDVAIIQITNPDRHMIVGSEPPAVAIIGTADGSSSTACKIGGTTGRTCGALGGKDQRYVMLDPDTGTEIHSVGDTASLCAQRGDSGGPVLSVVAGHETIIGLVSGTRSDDRAAAPECPGDGVSSAAGSIAYATSGQIMDVIYLVVPDALFLQVS